MIVLINGMPVVIPDNEDPGNNGAPAEYGETRLH